MPEFKFLARLTETPTNRTQIFRLASPRVDDKSVLGAAESFRMTGDRGKETWQHDANKISYSVGPQVVTMYRTSGALCFRDLSRWQMDDGKSNVDFKDDAAIEMAQKAIRQYGLAPLKELKVLKVTRLHGANMELASGRSEERVIDIGVAFQRVIGGVPVDGPGGKIIVYLDNTGAVTGVDRIWRTIQDVYRPVDGLRAPKVVEEEMTKYWSAQKSGRIDVHEFRFGYFEMGWQDVQRYLQPAYVIVVTLLSPNERFTMNSVYVSPAALKPVGTLMPEPLPQKRLRPRQA